jgi:hypothetical protein
VAVPEVKWPLRFGTGAAITQRISKFKISMPLKQKDKDELTA